jgi:hypothetical protein
MFQDGLRAGLRRPWQQKRESLGRPYMSRFRVCALPFLGWGITFLFFPAFTNEFAGVGYTGSRHALDWTQIVGLFSLAFAVLLNDAHRVVNPDVKRTVARAAITLTLPCAVLMTYWQLLADRQWIRLDIVNVLVLYTIGAVMLGPSEWLFRRASARRDRPVIGSAA